MFEYVQNAGLKPVRPYVKRLKTDCIIIHHSAGILTPAQIHAEHIKRGYKGIGYAIVIDQNGKAWWGRGLEYCGGGTKDRLGYNSRSVDICFIGNFENYSVPDLQLAMGKRVVRDLLAKYPGARILGHKDVDATACPGRHFPLADFKALRAVPAPADKPPADNVKRVAVARSKGRASVYAEPDKESKIVLPLGPGNLMDVLGTEGAFYKVLAAGKTGYVSGNRVEITSGVATTPAPVFKLARVLEVKSPIMKGSDVLSVQLELRELGYDLGKYGADSKYGGDMDKAVKAFQRDLKLRVDGEVGPITCAALGGVWIGK